MLPACSLGKRSLGFLCYRSSLQGTRRKCSSEETQPISALPTASLAPMVNQSEPLKKLFHMGVKLSSWEANGHLDLALSLHDFERQVQPTIEFLIQRLDLSIQVIAQVLTNAPSIIQIENSVLDARIQYLESKAFTSNQIRKIITKRGDWLTFSVSEVDNRLGYYQETFSLGSSEVRTLAVKDPSLIIWVGLPSQTRETLFAVKELMGFTKQEIKSMLLANPVLFRVPNEDKVSKMFDFLHNVIGYPHSLIHEFSNSLLGDVQNAKERHAYLKFIGRDQYNPTKPNYVSPLALTTHSDVEFCQKTAKTSHKTYNRFLKTL